MPCRSIDAPFLTVIMTCMGRLHHLQQSLPMVANQTGLQVIVVDYGCPDRAGDWVQLHFDQVRVVRAIGVTHFSVGKARNFGATHADTRWVCFLDADTLVGPDFASDLARSVRDRTFLLADPCPNDLTGFVVCSLDDFKRIGGYDDLFSGWGAEDRDFYARMERSGVARGVLPAQSIRVIHHGDSERTRYHDIPDRFVSLRINGMYLQIKTDLARLTEVLELPANDRAAIYERVRQLVLDHRDSAVKMDINLPLDTEFSRPPGWQLRRTISYVFEPSSDGRNA